MTSTNPIAQQRDLAELSKAFKTFTDVVMGKNQSPYSTPAPYGEAPQSYRSDYKSNPYQVDFQQLDQTRSRALDDAYRANQFASQNAENSANREIRKTQAASQMSDASYANQKRIDLNAAAQSANISDASYAKQKQIDLHSGNMQQQIKNTNDRVADQYFSSSAEAQRFRMDYDAQKNVAARKLLADKTLQAQNNNATLQQQREQQKAQLRQQSAQQQAQERLAKINQQTSFYQTAFGSPGESTWRWF